jgi:hypothetical protein
MNQVTYSVQGLGSSHSAVLRSMVLLTEKSVDCAWQAQSDSSADVLFLGEAANADDFSPPPRANPRQHRRMPTQAKSAP